MMFPKTMLVHVVQNIFHQISFMNTEKGCDKANDINKRDMAEIVIVSNNGFYLVIYNTIT